MFATGLRFGVTTGDAATVTSVGAIDGLTSWSVVTWFRIRSFTLGGTLVSKGAGGTNTRRINVAYSATGALTVALDRTSDLSYSTPSGTLAINQPYALVTTFNSGGSANDLVRFYLATPDRYIGRIQPSTTTDGSGALTSDAGVNLVWGNNTAGTVAGPIDLYGGVLSSAELTPAEAEAALKLPRTPVRGTLGRWDFGNGGPTIWDQTGNGCHAAVSRAVPTTRAWNNSRWPRARIATALAAFRSAWARNSNMVYQPGIH